MEFCCCQSTPMCLVLMLTPMVTSPTAPVWVRAYAYSLSHAFGIDVTPMATLLYAPVQIRTDVDISVPGVCAAPVAAVPYAPVWIRTDVDPSLPCT